MFCCILRPIVSVSLASVHWLLQKAGVLWFRSVVFLFVFFLIIFLKWEWIIAVVGRKKTLLLLFFFLPLCYPKTIFFYWKGQCLIFVCVYVCVCVCLFMWFMRTQICIMTWVWHRYYKEKVIYEDIFSVPIIQNAYKSYSVRFFGGKVEMHRLLWGLSLGVG